MNKTKDNTRKEEVTKWCDANGFKNLSYLAKLVSEQTGQKHQTVNANLSRNSSGRTTMRANSDLARDIHSALFPKYGNQADLLISILCGKVILCSQSNSANVTGIAPQIAGYLQGDSKTLKNLPDLCCYAIVTWEDGTLQAFDLGVCPGGYSLERASRNLVERLKVEYGSEKVTNAKSIGIYDFVASIEPTMPEAGLLHFSPRIYGGSISCAEVNASRAFLGLAAAS